MFTRQRHKLDLTARVATALRAEEVSNESEYPSDPKVNDAVVDASEGVLKLWDGTAWVKVQTRQG